MILKVSHKVLTKVSKQIIKSYYSIWNILFVALLRNMLLES